MLLIFAQGSVRGNTVPRDSIDMYTPGSRECIGYYDLCRSCHSISSLLPVDTKKYIPTVRLILTDNDERMYHIVEKMLGVIGK